jgi:hypothetical protein
MYNRVERFQKILKGEFWSGKLYLVKVFENRFCEGKIRIQII